MHIFQNITSKLNKIRVEFVCLPIAIYTSLTKDFVNVTYEKNQNDGI